MDVPEEIDLGGLKCPLPALCTRRALRRTAPGARLAVTCTDPMSLIDIPNLVREEGDAIESCERDGARARFVIRRNPDAPTREETPMSTREPPRTHPRIAGTRTVHEGWARYLVAELEAADGARFHREIEDHGRAACVLPYDPQARVAVLVEQFRAPVLLAGGPPSLVEAPAGALEADDVEAEVRREAYEEAGLRLGPLERVASAWTMPGVSTERMDLFLAAFSAADRAGAGGGLAEEHEEITVHDVPLVDLAAMSDRGEITDLKTLTLVLALRLRHPDLFGGG